MLCIPKTALSPQSKNTHLPKNLYFCNPLQQSIVLTLVSVVSSKRTDALDYFTGRTRHALIDQ